MAFLRPIPILIYRPFIGRYSADTDISKIFKSCFLPHIKNMMYFMPYLFFKTLKIRIYKLKFLKLQQFQYLVSLTCY